MSEKHLAKGSSMPVIPDDGKLILYSMRFCPYDQRAHLMLLAKKIPHHVININLGSKPEWFLERSSSGKVPTLEIPGSKSEPLVESLVVADYLDEKYPEILLRAKDPLQHAKDRIFIENFNTYVMSFYKTVFSPVWSEVTAETIEDTLKSLEIIEKELKSRGTKYLAGDKLGYVDYMVWPWCERVGVLSNITENRFNVNKERFAKFVAWKELMNQDPAVASHFATADQHTQFITSYKKNRAEADYDMLA